MTSDQILSMVHEFIEYLGDDIPVELAFCHENDNIFVVAIIEDDDDEMDKSLILAEAKINYVYRDTKLRIIVDVFERYENFIIPKSYIDAREIISNTFIVE